MTQTIEATYENGVFVPVRAIALTEHERVRLTVEPIVPGNPAARETVRHRRANRLCLDDALAADIASDPDFDLLDAP